ncbi:MAG: NUDIX domain-containing protein [Caldilineaceae bacterium]
MKIVEIEYDIEFLPKPNEAHAVLDNVLPPIGLITSALGLFFEGDCLLMTHLHSRGWDIPGGHVERGETPEQTVRREVYEETGAQLGEIAVLGHQKLIIHAPKPPNYKYPHPVSYQVLFWGSIAQLAPFVETAEVAERACFAPTEVQQLAWVQRHRPLYEAALALVHQQ